MRMLHICALFNKCIPEAANMFVGIPWERVSMLLAMAKTQQAKSPLH
jgi:hypothetical protein